MKLLSIIACTCIFSINIFSNEIASYSCKTSDILGDVPYEYTGKVGDERHGFKVVDVYKPTWLERIVGYEDSKKVPVVKHSERTRRPQEESKFLKGFEQYGELYEYSFSTATTTVYNFYPTCLFSLKPCEAAYLIYQEGGFDYSFRGYGFSVVQECRKN